MKNEIEQIKALYREQKFKEALALIETIEKRDSVCPDIFVWKGRCIQLADENIPYQLADAEKAYQAALDIDDEYIPAIIDLGYFYLRVIDDPGRGKSFFEKAIALQKDIITESVVGMAECLSEIEAKTVALNYLTTVSDSLLDASKLEELAKELEKANDYSGSQLHGQG